MPSSPINRRGIRRAGFAVLAIALLSTLAACGASVGSSPTVGTSGSDTPVTIGLTYVPNIQFAPFYVAQDLGYYKAEGLNVTLHHHAAAEDEFGALVAGQENMIFASGDEILGARSHGVPIVDVASVYRQSPITLIVPADSPIHTLADLRGHSIGVPGLYGATYIGLLGLLKSAGLTQQDVTIKAIGYTQKPALMSHQVDAVMGYLNNEPIVFQQADFPIRTFPVSGVLPLVSNGLAALEPELQQHPDVVKKVVAATLKGVQYVIAHPQQALKISEKYVPGLSTPSNAATGMAVLNATLPLWKTSGQWGYNNPQDWQQMTTLMQSQGLLPKSVTATQAYSNAYLPG